MARTAKNWKLDSKTARLKLAPRVKPYYQQIAPGKTLGYIRKASGPGAWVCREKVAGDYRRAWNVVADDDPAKADGRDVLTHEQALRKAGAPTTAPSAPMKVKEAFVKYLADLKARKGEKAEKDTRQRAEKHIYPVLGTERVDRLTKTQIGEWRAGLLCEDDAADPDARRRSMDSANRILTVLKAALNYAFEDEANGIATDKAWRTVKAFRDVGRAREDDFDATQVRKLVAEAAKVSKPFANLCEAGYLTGARYGELAALDVRHFDEERALLLIPDGKTGARPVTLSAEGVAFFKRMTHKRPTSAVLFPRADGDRWGKSEQQRPFKVAAKAAKLPASASFYTLRHSHISRAIEAGMPLSLVAENCGTSLSMIQKNYAHVLSKTRKATIDATAPRLRQVK